MSETVLVRYGAISEVARFATAAELRISRGTRVVVQSHRGLELGTLLEEVPGGSPRSTTESAFPGNPTASERLNGHAETTAVIEPATDDAAAGEESLLDGPHIVRAATAEDESQSATLQADCREAFAVWRDRIIGWDLDLELVDLEWMLDRAKLVLYVLNNRGPDCTKLALQAAAAGLGTIEVQPVDASGLVQIESAGGGCGSGGCGSGGCH